MIVFRDHQPAFLARLRSGARDRVRRRSGRLRRAGWTQLRYAKLEGFLGVFLMAVVGFSVGRGREDSLEPGGAGAVVSWAALFLVSQLERHMTGMLQYWPDLATSLRLPADDAWMVRRQWWRSQEKFPLTLLSAVALTLPIGLLASPTWTMAGFCLGAAVVLSAVVLVLATWLAGTNYGAALGMVLWGSLAVFWIGSRVLPTLTVWGLETVNAHGEWLTLILPTGWVVRPFLGSLNGISWESWTSLLPVAVLVASVGVALGRLPRILRLRDQALLMYAAQIPEDASEEFRRQVHEALRQAPRSAVGTLREAVSSRSFLEIPSPVATGGWLERWLWRCWSEGERSLAALAYVRLPKWTTSLGVSSALVVLGVASAALGGPENSRDRGWLLVGWLLALIALGKGVTPIRPEAGRLEQSWEVGQGTVVAVGLFPLGLAAVHHWALKTARLRLLMGSPLALLAAAVAGWSHPELVTPTQGVQAVLVALLIAVGYQPFWLAGLLLGSGGPRFGGRFGWVRHGLWLGWGLTWLIFSGAALGLTFWQGPGWGLMAAGASVATGQLAWRWLLARYRRGGLELVMPPRGPQ